MVGNPMRWLFLSKELLLWLRRTSIISSGINTSTLRLLMLFVLLVFDFVWFGYSQDYSITNRFLIDD